MNFYSALMRNQLKSKVTLVVSASLVIVLTSSPTVATAKGRDCVASACLSVYVENGQIVIEGRKDAPTPITTKRPRVVRTSSPTPRTTRSAAPLPSRSSKVRSPSIPPVVRKKIITKVVQKVVARVSLNDKLVKMLPVANIAQQPKSGAVVGLPVIYWCDLPAVFNTKVSVVGEVIDVRMSPAFFWSFGDGSIKLTTDSGAPYPSSEIAHTYSRPGIYPIVLVSIWGGTWVHNGVARAITGRIRKVSVAVVHVEPAPTVFQK